MFLNFSLPLIVILSRPAFCRTLRVFHLAAVFWGFCARLRIGSLRGVFSVTSLGFLRQSQVAKVIVF
jgi:hypothetical protein